MYSLIKMIKNQYIQSASLVMLGVIYGVVLMNFLKP